MMKTSPPVFFILNGGRHYLGRSVTVAGSEFISTREDREELEKSLDNRPAELEALKKSFH